MMKLEDILIKKEEIPILRKTSFIVPIYPGLLRKDLKIDHEIANRVFPQVAREWHQGLQEYVSQLEEGQEKTWINEVFLKHKPRIKKELHWQVVYPPHWEDQVIVTDTGFPQSLSICRNAGGSLFVREDQPQYLHPFDVLFSQEKLESYAIPELKSERIEGVWGHAYQHHNIDYYPGALFLRNWAILTLNEIIKQIGDKLLKP